MAATLTDELTRVTVADIEKWDEADGTVYVYGRCTTPEVDTDDQVVDSSWSGLALKEYLATAPTVRVQHNPQRDPAGSGVRVDINRDGDGAHWLKAAVDEPVAQRLVKKGHLRAFSVGIARPVIERDVTGKARGGVIKGGKIVEVSLVDSPANRSCFLEIAKSAADGTCEFTGKVGGSDDFLAKALNEDLLTKDAPVADDLVNVDLPRGASISISPVDFAALRTFKQQLVIDRHYDELALKAVLEAESAVYKRDIDVATRRRLAAEGNALPGNPPSYPIETSGDLSNAATLARSGHGDVAAARRLIARRAKELGVQNPLDESDEVKKGETIGNTDPPAVNAAPPDVMAAGDAVAKEAEPDLTKSCSKCAAGNCDGMACSCGKCADGKCACGVKKAKKAKKPKAKKKMPPWLNKPDGGDDGDDGSCKMDHAHTEKCHTSPAAAAGVTASAMDPAPVGELMESMPPASAKGATPASASSAVAEHMNPVARHREPDGAPMEALEADAGMSDGDDEKPTRLEAATGMKTATADLAADPEVAALLRFKAAGVDEDLGRLHDLTCPAYHPAEVAKYHPYADLRTLVDSGAWQKKTLAAAAGPLAGALKMQEAWQAALLLKTADPGDLNDWRLAAYKAFRDANPGPGTYPTPGSVSARRYCRPVLTDGRAADAMDYGMPDSTPQVATMAPNAMSFDRPPLGAGHQSPSPAHMKGDGQYPSEQGRPVQLTYAQMQKEGQRMALSRMHEHLARQFPQVCPVGMDMTPVQPENQPVPAAAGIGKAIDPEPATAAAVPPAAASFKAEPEDGQDFFADAKIYKGFKKMRKKLGKKVLSGDMTVDEARTRMGRRFAQKSTTGLAALPLAPADPLQVPVPTPLAQKAAASSTGILTRADVAAIAAEVQKSLHVESVPLEAVTIGSFDPSPAIEAAVTKAVTPLLEKMQQQDTKLAETQRVIDAIADQPDPGTAAFSGLAFKTVQKSQRPAAVPDQAEYAARATEMIRRNLQTTYTTHSNPSTREAASQALAKLGVPEAAS